MALSSAILPQRNLTHSRSGIPKSAPANGAEQSVKQGYFAISRYAPSAWRLFVFLCSLFFEIAFVLVRLDHVAGLHRESARL
jgi:hypothetical protein